jgi:NADPH-dependent curcumin reductase CurA
MKGKRWILATPFSGIPTEENLKLEEFDLPDELKENEVLLQAVYLTVDPYMRFGINISIFYLVFNFLY